MNLRVCGEWHDPVAYSSRKCPVCVLREEKRFLEGKVAELREENDLLEKKLDRLTRSW
jgi:hypothetical protein